MHACRKHTVFGASTAGSRELNVISLPTAFSVGSATSAATATGLLLPLGLPRIGFPFAISLWSAYPGTLGWFAASSSLGPPASLGSPFAPGSILDLDPTASPSIHAMTLLSPGLLTIDLSLQALPAGFGGIELFVEGILSDAGVLHLSNTLWIVPG